MAARKPRSDDFTREVDAFGRSLRARNRSPKTIRSYTESATLLCQFLVDNQRTTDLTELGRDDIEAFITDQLERHTSSTAATRYRCLQQFFKYLLDEEIIEHSPMAKMSPPSIGEQPVPVFTTAEMAALLKVTTGKGFDQRRDHAIIRAFIDTGVRLGEMAGIRVADLDKPNEAILVTGKGDRGRWVPMSPKLAVSLDRYERERRNHRQAESDWLWLGIRGRLTDSGIAQLLERRAAEAGVDGMHAHRFRHTFSHRWLAAGNNEGDLQRLAGWRSPQMLARYGASAAESRARDAYHRSGLWEDV